MQRVWSRLRRRRALPMAAAAVAALVGAAGMTTIARADTAWTTVDVGSMFTCAVNQDGTLWCWGRNDRGQLGLGDTDDRTVPVQVGADGDWASVSLGYGHAPGAGRLSAPVPQTSLARARSAASWWPSSSSMSTACRQASRAEGRSPATSCASPRWRRISAW
jgi:hypothetical protein